MIVKRIAAKRESFKKLLSSRVCTSGVHAYAYTYGACEVCRCEGSQFGCSMSSCEQ